MLFGRWLFGRYGRRATDGEGVGRERMQAEGKEAEEDVGARLPRHVLDGNSDFECTVGSGDNRGAERDTVLEIGSDLRVEEGGDVKNASGNEVIPERKWAMLAIHAGSNSWILRGYGRPESRLGRRGLRCDVPRSQGEGTVEEEKDHEDDSSCKVSGLEEFVVFIPDKIC